MQKTIRDVLALAAGIALATSAGPALADGMPEEPLARFEEPICPGVMGLQFDHALAVVDRIRANAAEFGLQTADETDCSPNLVVAFLRDGQEYLQQLNDERPWLFENLGRQEKRALLNQDGPVRAWITTETRTRDGQHVGRRINLVDIPQANMWSASSKIYVPTRQDIKSAMVLINRDATGNLTANQLGDYASLYGFAEFVPQADADTPSIQRLFDADVDAVPEALTEFDVSYLRRLYSSLPNLPAYARLEGLKGVADEQ